MSLLLRFSSLVVGLFLSSNTLAQTFSAVGNNDTREITLTWSTTAYYAEIYETVVATGVTSPVGGSGTGASSVVITRPFGTYNYSKKDCIHLGMGRFNCTYTAPIQVILSAVPQPPTVSASFSPTTINESSSATFSWSSSNATSCSSGDIGGVSATSGSVTYTAPSVMSSNQTKTITVTCSGTGGTNSTSATLNMNWVNDAPAISGIANQSLNEGDTTTRNIDFSVSDEESASLNVTAVSNNTWIISNVAVSGSGNNRTVSFTSTGVPGYAVITVSVSDGIAPAVPTSFTVTIIDLPTELFITNNDGAGNYTLNWRYNNSDYVVIDEQRNQEAWSNVVYGVYGSSGSKTLNKTLAGTYNYALSECISQNPETGDYCFQAHTKTVTVTRPTPTVSVSATPTSISEGGSTTINWSATHNASCRSNDISGVSGSSGNTTYTASNSLNANTSASFTILCNAGGADGSATVNLPINWINDTPDFLITNSVSATEDNPFYIPFTLSDEETPNANISWVLSSSDQSKIANSNIVPEITNNRLRVTPNENAEGNTTINIRVTDAHGAFVDRAISVAIANVNDAPSISGVANQNANEGDLGSRSVSVSVADLETPANSLNVTASSNNTSVVSSVSISGSGNNRSVNFVLAGNPGSAMITVMVSDGTASVTTNFSVTVNDLPAQLLIEANDGIGNYTLSWRYAKQSARLYESGPSGNVYVGEFGTSGNKTFNKTQNGSYAYSLEDCYYNPSNGQANCTQTDTKTITVTRPVPTVSVSANPTTINEGGSATISWSATHNASCRSNDIGGVSGSSGNTTYTASNSMSANTNASFTILCSTGGADGSATVNLPINWVNDTPDFLITNLVSATEDNPFYVPFTLSDEETPNANISWVLSSSNQSKIANSNISVEISNNRLRVTPSANAEGNTTLNIRVTDAHGGFVDRAVNVNIANVNDAPSISGIANQSINENTTTTGSIPFTVNDIDGNALTVTATSSNTTFIPNANLIVSGSGNNRAITVNPTGTPGSSTITLSVSDGIAPAVSTNFTVTVVDLPPQLLIDTNDGAGNYTLSWKYANTAVKLFETRNQESAINVFAELNASGYQSGNGSKTFTKTRDGTYVYQLQDCVFGHMGAATCTNVQTQSVTVNLPAPAAPTLTLSATTSIVGNYSVSWSDVTGANTYELLENDAPVNNEGNPLFKSKTYTTKLTNVYRYKVRACNISGCGAYSPEQSVTVTNPTVTASFDPATIGESGTATLNWSSNNATACSATNISGVSATSGSVVYAAPTNMSASTSVSVVVTCSNGGVSGSTTATLTINPVNDLPVILSFASPISSRQGQTFYIPFSVTDEETPAAAMDYVVSSDNPSVIANNNILVNKASSRLEITPAASAFGTAKISLIAKDADGASSPQHTSDITIQRDGLWLISINAGNYSISWNTDGQSVQLTESSEYGSSLINEGVSGTKNYTKTRDGNYNYNLERCVYGAMGAKSCTGYGSPLTVNVVLPVPSVPTLSVSSVTSTGNYSVSWNDSFGTNTYELLENNVPVSNDGNPLFTTKNISAKATSIYKYKVRACNKAGCSAYSTEQTIKVANPLNITAVTASLNGATGVANLLVTIPINASYYEVQTRVNLGAWGATQTFNTTNITLPAITTTGNLNYQVRACDAVSDTNGHLIFIDNGGVITPIVIPAQGTYSNCSNWISSNTVVMSLPVAPTLSLPATNTTGSYTINWNSIANSTHYVLNENGGDLPSFFTNSHNTTKTNGSYTYQLRACNVAGCGVQSVAAKIDVAKVGAMANVTAALDQNTAIATITWSAVEGATRFDMQPFRNGEALSAVFTLPNNQTSFSFDPMTLPGDYYATVKACATVGAAESCSDLKTSNTVSPIVPQGSPRLSTSVSNTTTGVFTLNWTRIDQATHYELFENEQKIATVSSLNYSFNGATTKPSGTYTYKARACKVLCGEFSNLTQVKVTSNNASSRSSQSVSSLAPEGQIEQRTDPLAACPNDYTYKADVKLCESNTNSAVKIAPEFSCASMQQNYNGSTGYCEDSLLTQPVSKTYVSTYESDAPTSGEVVGSLPGDVMVNPGGAATYSIPLSVPQGIGDFTPTISLDYNSGSANELLGVGWSLSAGVSSISRCPQTLRLDGQVKGINFSASDRFCINGVRLLLVSGTYGESGSAYALENDEFTRYKAVGGIAGNPDSFEAIGKNGAKIFFGEADNSRQKNMAGTHTFVWSVSKREDRSGNSMTYHYTNEGTEFYVNELKYAYASGSALSSVKFNYGTRQDPQMRMVAGQRFEAKHRLTSIDVVNNSTTVKTYKIDYANVIGKFNINSRIESIQECAGSLCLPKTTFEWTGTDPGFGPLAFTLPMRDTTSEALAEPNTNQHDIKISRWQFLDTNRDGSDDIFYTDGSFQYRREWQGNGFSNPMESFSQHLPSSEARDYSDVNGDGQYDVHYYTTEYDPAPAVFALRYTKKAVSFMSHYENGNWSFREEFGKIPLVLLLNNKTAPFTATQAFTIDSKHLGDVNSDGIVDLILNDNISVYVNGRKITDDELYTVPNRGFNPADWGISADDFSRGAFFVGGGSGGDPERWFVDPVGGSIHRDTMQLYSSGLLIRLGHYDESGNLSFAEPYKVSFPTLQGGSFSAVNTLLSDFDNNGESEYIDDGGSAINLPLASGLAALAVHPNYVLPYATDGNAHSLGGGSFTFDVNSDGAPEIISRQTYQLIDIDTGTDSPPTDSSNISFFNPSTEDYPYLSFSVSWETDVPQGFAAPILDFDNDGIPEFWNKNMKPAFYFTGETQHVVDTPLTLPWSLSLSTGAGVMMVRLSGKRYFVFEKFTTDNVTLNFYPELDSTPGMKIKTITNGLGARTEIDYEDISYSTHYKTVGSPNDRGAAVKDSLCLKKLGDTTCEEIYNGAVTTQEHVIAKLNQQLTVPADAQTLPMQYQAKDIATGVIVATKVRQFKSVATSAGVSSLQPIEKQFFYARARSQLQRGWLGFESMTTRDGASGLETQVVYRQDFPFTGTPYITQIRDTASNKVLSTRFDNLAFNESDGRYYVYSKKSTQFSLDEKTSDLIKTQITDTTVDEWGNNTETTVTTTGVGGEKKVVTAENEYGDDARFGLITTTKITRALHENNIETDQRENETAFTYTAAGLVGTITTEPNDAVFTSVLTKSYDSQGNLIQETLSAVGLTDRTSFYNYDTNKRYLQQTRDGKMQVISKVIWRNDLGQVTEQQDANGLMVYSDYNTLGQATGSYTNVGSWTQLQRNECTASALCVAGAAFTLKEMGADGSWTLAHVDAWGRTMRTESLSFDNRSVYVDTLYNRNSQVAYQSEPYYAYTTPLWTSFTYADLLARPTKIEKPGELTNTTAITEFDYDGFTTTTTNALNQTRTETKNAFGQVVEIVDALEGRRTHKYDAEDRLRISTGHGSTNDPHSLITEITYDKLGRKISLRDPDKGLTTYTYNAFGELITQTDAVGNRQVFTYDELGRQRTRTDFTSSNSIEAHARWYFDGAAPNGETYANAIGQLSGVVQSKSANDETCNTATTEVCEIMLHDAYGRAVKTVQHLGIKSSDGSYATSVLFDDIGRAIEDRDVLHQRIGLSGTRSVFNDNGYTTAISDLHSSAVLQQVESMNARNQVTSLQLGNAMRRSFTYNDRTGRFEQQRALDYVGTAAQDIAYRFDDLGNLTYRHNQSGVTDVSRNLTKHNLAETFCYDELNRLIKVKMGDVGCSDVSAANQDQQYNSLGSITYKNEIGSYTYANSGNSHAVTSTSNGSSYSYDAKGNLLSGSGGRQLTYTVFDVPSTIKRSPITTTQFYYGPDRQRWKQVETTMGVTTTTLYLGNVERITKSTVPNEVEWRRYAADAVITLKTDKAWNLIGTRTEYVLKDQQGSPDVITDEIGAIIESQSFDAWGKRRIAFDGSAIHPVTILKFKSTTGPRGYTSHEMLDSTGFIHMNGRVYDPILARFVSADIMVPDPMDVQSYNRYSYVRNRPLSVSDPSGFADAPPEELLVTGTYTSFDGNNFSWDYAGRFNNFSMSSFNGYQNPQLGTLFGTPVGSSYTTLGQDNLGKKVSDAVKMTEETQQALNNPLGTVEEKVNASGDIDIIVGKKDVKAIVLHRTGGSSAEAAISSMKKTGLGVHYVIDKDGKIYKTSPLNERPAHVGKIKSRCMSESNCLADETKAINALGWNPKAINNREIQTKSYPNRYPTSSESIGIEVVGSYNQKTKLWDTATDAQLSSIKTTVTNLQSTYGLTNSDVYHHDVISYKTPGEGAGLGY